MVRCCRRQGQLSSLSVLARGKQGSAVVSTCLTGAKGIVTVFCEPGLSHVVSRLQNFPRTLIRGRTCSTLFIFSGMRMQSVSFQQSSFNAYIYRKT